VADAAPAPRIAQMQSLIARIRAGEVDLTDRQKAVLMIICLTEGPHRTRDLAATLGVLKPVITRVMNTLSQLGFMRRDRNEADHRDCYAVATAKGRDFVERMG
jgi:DNA-binding MarR family transcriptional regulator